MALGPGLEIRESCHRHGRGFRETGERCDGVQAWNHLQGVMLWELENLGTFVAWMFGGQTTGRPSARVDLLDRSRQFVDRNGREERGAMAFAEDEAVDGEQGRWRSRVGSAEGEGMCRVQGVAAFSWQGCRLREGKYGGQPRRPSLLCRESSGSRRHCLNLVLYDAGAIHPEAQRGAVGRGRWPWG